MPSNASAAISLDLAEMSAENEASEGARFEHLVLPQAGDSCAGAFYELGLARAGWRGLPSASPPTPEVTTASHLGP